MATSAQLDEYQRAVGALAEYLSAKADDVEEAEFEEAEA
jgi:hypothetical protein